MPLISMENVDPSVRSAAEFRQYKVCCAAIWCLRHEADVHYHQERGSHQYAQLKPPPYVPEVMDCSFFIGYCYKVAGCPDPYESDYKAISTTNELYRHGTLVGGANVKEGMLQPGDVTFEGLTGNFFTHVCLYVGGGEVISHGGEGGPLKRSYKGWSGGPLQAVRRYPF